MTLSTPAMKKEKIVCHDRTIALLAGLIFVAHPIQTQSVTYIVQRAASMAALFYLASLCFYIKSRLLQGSVSNFYYTGSLIAAIAAMFTKENAITLPLMIVLYEFSFLRSKKNIRWEYSAPFFFTLIIIFLTMLLTKSVNFKEMHRITEASPGISPTHYFLTQMRVMITYIRLVFLPFNQNLDYDYPVFKSIFNLSVLSSGLFLLAIIIFAKRLFLKYRLMSFSIFWFVLTLLPESSIFPIRDVIYEHRLYLPMVGFSIGLVSSMYYLWGKNFFKILVFILTMIIMCYSVLTYQRNKIWKDEITLWSDTISKSPHKARGYNNRGLAYYQKGDFILAMSDYNHAIDIDPNYATAYFNRGRDYAQQGDSDQTMTDYNKAIEINPGTADVYTDRGILYAQQGDFIQATKDFTRGIEINPKDAKAYYNRGLSCAKQGDLIQAVLDYNKAIEIDQNYVDAYYNRGLSYAKQGDFWRAVSDYNKDIELNPNDAQAYNNRAAFYYQLKRYDQAWTDVHKAQELGVDVSPQLINLLQTASKRNQ